MAAYRKRPIIVDAVQFDPTIAPWPDGIQPGSPRCLKHDCSCRQREGYIETLEGPMEIHAGDWLITGLKGEKYPIKDEIFRLSYEPAGRPPGLSFGAALATGKPLRRVSWMTGLSKAPPRPPLLGSTWLVLIHGWWFVFDIVGGTCEHLPKGIVLSPEDFLANDWVIYEPGVPEQFTKGEI